MKAVSSVVGRVSIRQGVLSNTDISKATVDGVSVASAGTVVMAPNRAVTIEAGMAHRNFGDTVHSASMNAMRVPGSRAWRSVGIEDRTARNLSSVHERMEPRIAGDDVKNWSRSSKTDSGRLANRLGNAMSTSRRLLSVGGGSEANACCEPKTPSSRTETVAEGTSSRTRG